MVNLDIERARRGTRWGLAGTAACLLALVAGCQPWPVAQCDAYIDARKERLVQCGVFASRAEADADFERAIREGEFRECGEVERIVLPDLWELACIPETRAQPCSQLAETPNACSGQLVYRRPG